METIEPEFKICPYCLEKIRWEAVKCRFCAELLEATDSNPQASLRTLVPPDFKLSVVIPIFNEKDTVQKLVETLVGVPINKEIILVDDASTDGTREMLEEWQQSSFENVFGQRSPGFNTFKTIFHPHNQGKGSAIRSGFRRVKGDAVIIQDADLEYNPNEYFRLLAPIWQGKADVVYGSRFLGQIHRVLYFWHYAGNKIITTFSNMFTDLNLTDMESCYKVFKREVIEKIEIEENRFGFEPEITAKIAKLKCRIYEVPISYYGRTYEEGKKITWKDGIQALYCVVKYGLSR
jgi:glycosyltransferase involved in cell wall biosynthesis